MKLGDALQRLIQHQDLTEQEAYEAMNELMSGAATPELIAGFLAALRVKTETIPEITGFARAMREKAIRIKPKVKGRLIDTCSTGGAVVKTFNLGTTSAFVAAAGGAFVAKHGNRSTNRPCGSADLLEALGVNLQLPPDRVQGLVETVGVGFLFAPAFHPAMKHAAGPRKALGIRTVFNVLGPLTNPAGAQGQVLGVYDAALVEPLAHVLNRLGTEHAIVLHGEGADEPALHGVTRLAEVKDGTVKRIDLRAADLGLPDLAPDQYGPLPPAEAAQEAKRVLAGGDGARRSAVEFSAGLALYVAGRSRSIGNGIQKARELLDSRTPLAKLEEFVTASQRVGASAP